MPGIVRQAIVRHKFQRSAARRLPPEPQGIVKRPTIGHGVVDSNSMETFFQTHLPSKTCHVLGFAAFDSRLSKLPQTIAVFICDSFPLQRAR